MIGNGINLFASTANATVGNSTAEATLIGAGQGSLTVPANSLYAGRTYSIIAYGYYSTAAISVGSFTVRIKLDGVTIGTVAASGLTIGASNRPFQLRMNITCRTDGASGTVMCQGDLRYVSALGTNVMDGIVNTTVAVIDTTAPSDWDVTAQWGLLNAANTVTVTNMFIQSWN